MRLPIRGSALSIAAGCLLVAVQAGEGRAAAASGPSSEKPATGTTASPAPAPSSSQGGKYCHSINDGKGGRCRTGATQFCESVPIVPTNSAQAHDACTACMGDANGGCNASATENGGNGWMGFIGADITIFQHAKDAFSTCSPRTEPGVISNGSCKAAGRWAP